ncbi:MAG: Periplasmic [NiFeSe] hydrogenase small subunit [Candidatus Magnetoglobus multicellularis str. Araruama]|uniref:Periplasmic [NiFeSe] hydrogenase small subunit n=1 Tax=Candidatus Magnetoglobus multicellularis str. Araruama TaxID=890399 RepID=A0A1V1PCF6_9BACT|nr:MAG: Periplasmic [NiFeSe] hydrogenase small subunit [Candidatus Magnetoglobus multicellularis str. Araruama]
MFTRREFITLSARLTALLGLTNAAVPQIANALNSLVKNDIPVVWLQGQSCSGCSVSLLNSVHPDTDELLTQYISLLFHSTLSFATGHVSMEVLNKSIDSKHYYLVVEGSIPEKMPKSCIIGEELFTEQVLRASKNAKAIIAVGTCASFGGIPAAQGNPTGAIGLPAYLKKHSISKPLILLPGCPVHPDWIIGTLAHVVQFGLPSLDTKGRPKYFFSRLIHDQCPRFADYERQKFAKRFSDEGCLFKLGCLGPETHADCTIHKWNSGVSSCINAGGPCIGCASEGFPGKKAFSLYRKGENKS